MNGIIGKSKNLLQRQRSFSCERKEESYQSIQVPFKINMILGSILVKYDSNIEKKMYAKQVLITSEYGEGVTFIYHDPLVISTFFFNQQVYEELMDDKNIVNIISNKNKDPSSRLMEGLGMLVKCALRISITNCTSSKYIYIHSTNLHGRPLLHRINFTINIRNGYNVRESNDFKTICLYLLKG
ncbi:hypothetical protein SADUNF_Sadunf04G0063300 [Salix dunnii]|uniref:Uncharacterized protein n=1 Tax=Salix dunnii TaxID=1413687 RepID=A0A835K460_9ROSI|nr:hypothetical protein SADUNF_Sadunf04G0063300 [Salix dunnii]